MALLALLSALAIGYGYFTAYSANRYFEATHQRLNADVAAHIAEFSKPFLKQGVNRSGADAIFFNTMVTNPSTEVYLLDTAGVLLLYHAPVERIRRRRVSLAPIRQFIRMGGTDYVKGDDPRSEQGQKIFSAAEVRQNGRLQGYVYVILGGEAYQTVMEQLFRGYVLPWGILILLTTLTAAGLMGLLWVYRLRRSMNVVIDGVRQFQQGDLSARIPVMDSRELALVANTFNDMAMTLADSVERLTQSERVRRELVANISHDLRTPITAIHGYAQALTTHALPVETQQKYADTLVQSTGKLVKLIDELAELTKLEARETVPVFEPFPFADVLGEVLTRFTLLAESQQITLTCLNCQLPVICLADVGLIERVLQNLLENALKNTPTGGTVRVELRQSTPNVLTVIIENTVFGFPGSLALFLTSSSSARSVGTASEPAGLGLSIVDKMLSLHHTRLQVGQPNPDTLCLSFDLPVFE